MSGLVDGLVRVAVTRGDQQRAFSLTSWCRRALKEQRHISFVLLPSVLDQLLLVWYWGDAAPRPDRLTAAARLSHSGDLGLGEGGGSRLCSRHVTVRGTAHSCCTPPLAGEVERYLAAILRDSAHLAEQGNKIPSLDTLNFVMESQACGHTVMAHRCVAARCLVPPMSC